MKKIKIIKIERFLVTKDLLVEFDYGIRMKIRNFRNGIQKTFIKIYNTDFNDVIDTIIYK